MTFSPKLFIIAMCITGAIGTARAQGYRGVTRQVSSSDKIVYQIDFRGNHVLSTQELENQLPFSRGDAWRGELFEASRKALTEYLQKRGFYHAQVKLTPTQEGTKALTLLIDIEEGPPCVIESFQMTDPPFIIGKSANDRFKTKMRSVIDLKVGDRYDEQLVAEKLRILQDWLMDEDYILAATDNVKLSYNDDQTSVRVTFAVEYGEKVTFGYQGSSIFSKAELNEFIQSLRRTGLGKDYVGSVIRKFQEEYQSRAYNSVSIKPKYSQVDGGKHVTLVIEENERSFFKELQWEGLTAENLKLAKKVFGEGVSRLVQRGYFVEKDVDKGIQLVLEELKSRGYLSSKLVARSIQKDRTDTGKEIVRVLVQVSEGEQTFVASISLEGFSHLSAERVYAILGVQQGKPFNPFGLEEGLELLRSTYFSDAFLDFKILTPDNEIVSFYDNNRAISLRLAVSEGIRIKVGDIRITGLQQTRRYIVEREIEVKKDDWWIGSKIQEIETNIKRLGIFSDVKLKPEPSEYGAEYRDLYVEVKEADPGVLEFGPGYRSDLGLRSFAKLSYSNLLGKNWITGISGNVNRRLNDQYRFVEYRVEGSFIEPRFFDTRNSYLLGASLKRERFPPDFNADTKQFSTGFERRAFSNILSLKLLYKFERIQQFDVFINGAKTDDDNQTMLIGSITPSVTIDTRDSPFTTTKGTLTSLWFEFADPVLSSRSREDKFAPGYYRWSATTHLYIPIYKEIIWSNVLGVGFARSNVSGRAIPLIKLFRLGGYSTIRGYKEDSLNVDTRSITGTLTYLNLRTQFDLPLVGELKFAPFLDAGNLYVDQWAARPFFRAGAGFGFHYLTPIGPVNLDYGFKLNPRPNDEPTQIHFSVGFI